jgi:hypothetical protein
MQLTVSSFDFVRPPRQAYLLPVDARPVEAAFPTYRLPGATPGSPMDEFIVL